MRAYRLVAAHRAELTTVPRPAPGAGEVLIRVGAAGVCHSDLHILDAPAEAGFPLPLTLGHEIAGWVEACGTGVSGWAKGEAVAVYGVLGCGRCAACLRGRDNECRIRPVGGIGISRDGGMAEYVAVPAGQLLAIGELEVERAAPLTDAGLTPYHAMQICREGLVPGSTCVVIGVGGLGHMAVQILAATTATRIVAVDGRAGALERAKAAGAEQALAAGAETAQQIRALVGPAPGGAAVVLDFVGSSTTLALGAAVISTGGWMALVGLAGGELMLRPGIANTGVPFETRVVMPFWGTRAELGEVIALARSGRIGAQVERFALADVRTAYERLRAGEVRGRAVVVPEGARSW